MVKHCSKCQQSLPEEAFSKKQWSAKAHERKCVSCVNEAQCTNGPEPDRQHQEAQAESKASGRPTAVAMPELLENLAEDHVPGRLVRIKGLVNAHQHNGKLCTVLPSTSSAGGRVGVVLKDGKELGLKQENIEAVCLACFSPSVFACGKCRTATFCSAACQSAKWLQHMNECGDGRLARADCQVKLKPSETVFFLGRCDGNGAFYLSALHRTTMGGTVLAQLLIGISRGILDVIYDISPHFQTWKSAAQIKAHFERVATELDLFCGSEDARYRVGDNGTHRETNRRIGTVLAAALARHAETETLRLNPQILHTNLDILKALDVFRRRGSTGSSDSANDSALLADPLLGSCEAAKLKQLIASELMSGYQCGVRLVQLLQEENSRLLDWYGVIYNMLHCRGEYRYCFSFVEFAQEKQWDASWLPKGTTNAQKLEAVLLGMSQASDPTCRAWVVKVAPMMRHMSLWHTLGGEDNMAALALLAAEDAEACWHNSAIVVGLMISSEPERFQRHVKFEFAPFRARLHSKFLHHWCAMSMASSQDMAAMSEGARKEKAAKKQQPAAAAGVIDARAFVDKANGRKFTFGSGFSDVEIDNLSSEMRGMGMAMERTAPPELPFGDVHVNILCVDDVQGLSEKYGFAYPGQLIEFCQHVSNRRQRTQAPIETRFDPLYFESILQTAIPDDSIATLEGKARLLCPPAGVRLQLADIYMWGSRCSASLNREGEEEQVSIRDRRRRGMQLLQDAADVEDDCEAMVLLHTYAAVC
jgi:hypothetical protein